MQGDADHGRPPGLLAARAGTRRPHSDSREHRIFSHEHRSFGGSMRHGKPIVAATAGLLLLAGSAAAQVTEQNFRGGRTSDLAALCAASGQEALGQAAQGYCQGFMIGAGQYHRALTDEGGVQKPVFCLPNPSPTFDQARSGFVAWARANPQHAAEPAIDGLMRFAAATYPCPSAPASRPRR
jgi:Rap1a immunity proteins